MSTESVVSTPPLAEARAAMNAAMAEAGGPAGKDGWAAVWARDLTLWDLKGATPVIQAEVRAALEDGRVPRGGAVLVPGCGAAHDVRALAAQGLRATGADIVEAAVEAARAAIAAEASAAGGSASAAAGSASVVCADFFDASAASAAGLADGAFDLLVDYTFFCAIVPAQRAAWGARVARLLRPGARLLTIAYPLAPDAAAADPKAAGPPHPVSVAQYRAALEPHGVEMEGEPRASALSVPQRAANELVVWWRRRSL